MAGNDLAQYIADARSRGSSDADIRAALLQAGWNAGEVDAALKTPTQIISQVAANSAPVEVLNANVFSKSSGTGPKRSIVKILVPVIVVLALVASGGVAYKAQLLPFGKKVSNAELVAQLGDATSKINSSLYSVSLTIESRPRDADAVPFEISMPNENASDISQQIGWTGLVAAQNMYLSFLPTDVKITISASGTTASVGDSTDARFEFGSDVRFGDFAASVAAAFLKKGDTYYIDVMKFPALFLDLSPIKNKWVRFTMEDVGASYIGADSLKSFEGKRDQVIEQGKRIYTLALEEGVLIFTPSGREDGTIRHYRVAVVRDKYPGFYKRLSSEFQQQYGDDALVKFDQKVFDYLNSKEFEDAFSHWDRNGSINAWIDGKTGFPARLVSTYRFVPPDSALKLKNTQFLITAEVSLDDINTPVAIDPPSEFISFDDAAILLSGKPKDVYFYEKQLSNIRALRAALESYKRYAGAYPDSLEGLVTTIAEARKLDLRSAPGAVTAPPYLAEYESSVKILATVPSDVFTKKPYAYAKTASDFTLMYTINIPSSPSEDSRGGIFGYDSYAGIKVVEGENTATSKTFSIEGDRGER